MSNSEQKLQKSLWFDQEKGQYSIVNNENGESKTTYFTGEKLKKYSNGITGTASYTERIQASFLIPELKPPSLVIHSQNTNYLPTIDKLEGYSQFPSGICQPYFNQINTSKLKSSVIPSNLKPILNSKKNSNFSLFEEERNRNLIRPRITNIPSFFTSTLCDYTETVRTQCIPIMKHRKNIEFRKSNGNIFNEVKIINGITMRAPTQSSITRIQSQPNLPTRIRYSQDSSEHRKISKRIDQRRYETKIDLPLHRTHYISLEDPEMSEFQNQISSQLQINSSQNLENTLSLVQSSTYKNSDIRPTSRQRKLKSLDYFTRKVQREKEELEGFKLVKELIHKKIHTKGRFNIELPSFKR